MKPQPPVTRIRTATASSAQAGALADFPILGPQIEAWRNALAESPWTPWLIIGLAAFLRFFLLGVKPPHFDEGINGWFVDQLVKNGYYKYDPTNYHGPLHFYVLLLSKTLLGRSLWVLRLLFDPRSLAVVFYHRVFLRRVRFVEIRHREFSLVGRDGTDRHDVVEGDLHAPRRLRDHRGGRLLRFNFLFQ